MNEELNRQYREQLGAAIKSQNCMLMVGYGLSAQLTCKDGRLTPVDWQFALKKMADWCQAEGLINFVERAKFDELVVSGRHITAATEIDTIISDREKIKQCLDHVLLCESAQISQSHLTIAKLPFLAYLTMNYDTFIENACTVTGKTIKTFYETETQDALNEKVAGQPFVMKLCGDIARPKFLSLADLDLTERLKSPKFPLIELRNLFSGFHCLFIGFEAMNPDLACLHNLCKPAKPGIFRRKTPHSMIFDESVEHWIVVPEKEKDHIKLSENIHVIILSASEGLEGFLAPFVDAYAKRKDDNERIEQKTESEYGIKVANGTYEKYPEQENGKDIPDNVIPIRGKRIDSVRYDSVQKISPLPAQNEEDTEQYVDFDLFIAPGGYMHAHAHGDATGIISPDASVPIIPILEKIEKNEVSDEDLKDLGKKLYKMIFTQDIDKLFYGTEAVANSNNSNMRIRLTIDDANLALLPWEFMYREDIGGYFLAVNPRTVLSRYINMPFSLESVRRRTGILHMLIIIANPIEDEASVNSNESPSPDEWVEIIEKALKEPCQQKLIKIETVKHATFEEITDALRTEQPDIIQFVGRSIYDDNKKKGFLALVDSKTNGIWKLDAERFANLFLGHDRNLGLVNLLTFEGGLGISQHSLLDIASHTVKRGFPAVVAMRYSLPIRTAEIFLRSFYKEVAARKPMDWAVQQARNAIFINNSDGGRDFGSPILYMRARDGNIF